MLADGRYTHLVEANLFGVIVADAEGIIYEANNAFLDMVGYSREELLNGGVRWHQLTPPEYQEAEERASQNLIEFGKDGPWEKLYLRKDGTTFPALVSGVIIDKEQVRAMAFIFDLTEQKRIERERQQLLQREQEARAHAEIVTAQLAATFEAITDGVSLFDANGHMFHTNAAGRELLGVDTSDVNYIQKSFVERLQLLQPRDERGHPLAIEQWPIVRILAGEVIKEPNFAEMRLRTLYGREVEVSVSGAPIYSKEGRITGGVMVFRDVTARREQTRRTQAHLESQRDLAEANEQAQRTINQRMDEFISIASHELRNPITTIRGLLQLAQWRLRPLLKQTTRPLGEKALNTLTLSDDALNTTLTAVHDLLVRAEQQLMVQNRLVGDLLDSTRVQSDRLELHPSHYDLVASVRQVVEDQRRNAPGRTIALHLPEGHEFIVTADEDRIAQVLTNYMTNALKYSPAERPIKVLLEVEEATHSVCVSVSDQGPGLTPDDQQHVWERFYRVFQKGSSAGTPSGLGLGLHICRAIIEQHGGRVGVQSEVGRGSTFWFSLPYDSSSH